MEICLYISIAFMVVSVAILFLVSHCKTTTKKKRYDYDELLEKNKNKLYIKINEIKQSIDLMKKKLQNILDEDKKEESTSLIAQVRAFNNSLK